MIMYEKVITFFLLRHFLLLFLNRLPWAGLHSPCSFLKRKSIHLQFYHSLSILIHDWWIITYKLSSWCCIFAVENKVDIRSDIWKPYEIDAFNSALSHELGREWASTQANECRCEQCGASEWVSGVSEWASRLVNGPHWFHICRQFWPILSWPVIFDFENNGRRTNVVANGVMV